jgi:Tfp pilus assembly protein PilF
MRRYPEADTVLHKALALRNDPVIWSDLAAVYQSQHKEAQALELLRQAVLEAPPGQGRARIRANLGVLEWKTGARADGEVSLREALDETVTAVGPNHPDTAWVLENYSEVLRKSGRKGGDRVPSDLQARFR